MKMKQLFLFTLISISTVTSNTTFAQFSEEENEMMEVVKLNGAYIPSSAFLDTSVIKKMKLANSTSWRHLWVENADTAKKIKQFYDIRLKFDSKKEAEKFHKKFLLLNSEHAEKIKIHGIKSEGTSLFSVYKGGKEYAEMMDPYGYQIICFLYVIDDYYIKQYITCKKEFTPSDFQNFIDSTISRIHKDKK